MNLQEQISDYLSHLFESPRTQHTYETGLHVFLAFCSDSTTDAHGKTQSKQQNRHSIIGSLDAISTDILQDFQAWLGAKEYSRFSQRTYIASVVAFLNYSLSKDWLPSSFSLERSRAKLKQVTRRSSYPIPRPDPSLPSLIAYYDKLPLPEGESTKVQQERLRTLRSRAFVHLLYSSAGRLAEVAALDRKDVADGRRKEAIVTGKGDKERFIFITPEARASIATYVRERHDSFEPLFISHGRNYGTRLSHDSLWNIIKQASRKLGIDVSPHDFRHYRARQMLEQGAPLEAIQEILGHSDIGTTRRVYAHYSKPSIRTIFERTTLTPQEASKRIEETREDSTED